MKSAVVLLPGLNRDRDMIAALTKISGRAASDRLGNRLGRSPMST
jgi:phosphoribosylformylglycinamidine (FGAM) synthase-like amidotransferase family enzyme